MESSDVISKSGNPKWLNNSYHLYFYSNNNTTVTPKPFNISSIELERLGEVYVDIPDANFKQILLNNAQINLNGDSEISIDEAESYTGQIIAEDTNISSLNGIGAFKNITELWCRDMGLTDIDISENTALTFLVCFGNNFTSLDLTKHSFERFKLLK